MGAVLKLAGAESAWSEEFGILEGYRRGLQGRRPSVLRLEIRTKVAKEQATLTPAQFEAFQQGDDKAFRLVFDSYFKLVRFALRRLGARDAEIDEITQETFLRCYNHRETILDYNGLKSWLVVTAKRQLIDRRRRDRRLEFDEDVGKDQADVTVEDQESKLIREVEVSIVGGLIDKLATETGGPELIAFYREGLSVKEIAARNDEPVGTVTARLTRLRARLKKELQAVLETV